MDSSFFDSPPIDGGDRNENPECNVPGANPGNDTTSAPEVEGPQEEGFPVVVGDVRYGQLFEKEFIDKIINEDCNPCGWNFLEAMRRIRLIFLHGKTWNPAIAASKEQNVIAFLIFWLYEKAIGVGFLAFVVSLFGVSNFLNNLGSIGLSIATALFVLWLCLALFGMVINAVKIHKFRERVTQGPAEAMRFVADHYQKNYIRLKQELIGDESKLQKRKREVGVLKEEALAVKKYLQNRYKETPTPQLQEKIGRVEKKLRDLMSRESELQRLENALTDELSSLSAGIEGFRGKMIDREYEARVNAICGNIDDFIIATDREFREIVAALANGLERIYALENGIRRQNLLAAASEADVEEIDKIGNELATMEDKEGGAETRAKATARNLDDCIQRRGA